MNDTTIDPVDRVIEHLRKVYTGDKFHFDFSVAQYLAGDNNKNLRKVIVKKMTGDDRPSTECTMHGVADILKNSFDQLKLF